MANDHFDDESHAMYVLLRNLPSNMIRTDIKNVMVSEVTTRFMQEDHGYRIAFDIGSHAIGKADGDADKALVYLRDKFDIREDIREDD